MLFVILDKIGYALISRVVGGVFTIVTLISSLDNIKAIKVCGVFNCDDLVYYSELVGG